MEKYFGAGVGNGFKTEEIEKRNGVGVEGYYYYLLYSFAA